MSLENDGQQDNGSADVDKKTPKTPWNHMIRGMWRTPLGLLGLGITTVSITVMIIGAVVDILGLIDNPYVGILIYMVLPGAMIFGLLLIPLAAWLRRRQWHKHRIEKEHLFINLSNHAHRAGVLAFLVLTVFIVATLVLIGYEGYHFTDSPQFCGVVCHQVMEPEYTVYQRSPHSKIACVECHIGSGAKWFVRAKLSGLRQVMAVATDSYSRPIPAPVHALRPARDVCESCHWPEKFYGKKVKTFYKFSNEDQITPEKTDISLHIGGRNPETGAFEGIHWHVSKDVQVSYLPADDKRTKIAKVRIKRADGSTDEFVKPEFTTAEAMVNEWRVMDCIDCHNRPTHIYDLPEERVDFGLLSKKINPLIPGIREDCLTVLTKEYPTREQAKEQILQDLTALQKTRDPEQVTIYADDLAKASEFLIETYLGNIWPEANVLWGTYKKHLGHQFSDDGYGCWRCHDEEHNNDKGETISQDCGVCHDDPE
jgi:hypothetical protein